MYKGYPFSKTTYYRRRQRATVLGCDIMNVPDGRGGHNNHVRGTNHPRWNSGALLNEEGYKLVRVGTTHPWADPNGYVYEHDLIMCSAIGRPLRVGEIVHHRNKDRLDNRLGNLELLTAAEHAKKHHDPETGRFVANQTIPDDLRIREMPGVEV